MKIFLLSYPKLCMGGIVVDSILWTSKTRKMTPFEVMTTLEGELAMLKECLKNTKKILWVC